MKEVSLLQDFPNPLWLLFNPREGNLVYNFPKLLKDFPRRLWLRSISQHLCSKADLGKFGSPNSLKRPCVLVHARVLFNTMYSPYFPFKAHIKSYLMKEDFANGLVYI